MVSDEELDTLNPELAAIFAKRGPTKLPIPTRKTLNFFRTNYAVVAKKNAASPFARAALGPAFDNPTWTERDHSIPVRDGSAIQVRTYVPSDRPDGGLPVLVVLRGGGWIMGDIDTEALTCRIFAARLGIIAVNVNYRLYPEIEFGVSAQDTIDAIKWTSANASSFHGDLRKGFIVAGVSGGATHGSVATHLLRQDNTCAPITGCFWSAPVFPDESDVTEDGEVVHIFDLKTENRSHEQHKEAPLMNREMQESIRNFATYDLKSPYFGPFHCPPFENIPRTYVQVCGIDPWRDTGRLYEQKIREAGCDTRLTIFAGLPHTFWTTFPHLKATQTYLKETLDGVRWLLQPKPAANL